MGKQKKKKETGGGNWKIFWNFLKTVRLPWLWMALAFGCNMLYSEVMLKLPTTTAGLLSGSLDKKVLWDAILFYIMFTIVICADTALRSPAQHVSARNARRTIWNRMLHIRMDYYDSNNPSDMMSTITNDTTVAMQSLTRYLVAFVPDIYYAVRALKTISDYNFWLMLSVFLLLPLKILYMIFVGRWRYKTQAGVYKEIGGLTAYLAERIRNLSLIKTYTNEKEELKNGEEAAHRLFDANMRVNKLECGITGLSTLIGLAQSLIVMVFGVFLLKRGDITLQQWVAFFMFSGTISNTFSTLIEYWTNLKTIQGTLVRASRLLTAPVEKPVPAEQEKQETPVPKNSGVVFDNVSFSYGDKQALKQVSFQILPGSVTAIIGLCGSGKTTIFSLLEGFYTPNEGHVRLGGVDVTKIPLKELRGMLGYAQQGAEIFSGTAREALTYGISRQVTDQEIWEASRQSGFADLLEAWELGLDTPIAAGGNFSFWRTKTTSGTYP